MAFILSIVDIFKSIVFAYNKVSLFYNFAYYRPISYYKISKK